MSNQDSILHVRGESRFLDDLPEPASLLHACVLGSPIAHGTLLEVRSHHAKSMPGVVAVLTAEDIPGDNQIGGVLADEPLLAEGELHYIGQPVALILADTRLHALDARDAMSCEVEKLPPILDPREAHLRQYWIVPPKTFAIGDVDATWSLCDHILTGKADSGGQEHLYLETQAAMALPGEGGTIRILSSTQAPTAVQRMAARVLGVPYHNIEVEVPRLGGGFGGKEDQATAWAALAALGANSLGRPVKLVLSRNDDLRMTGKRHPYSSDFKIGFDSEGRILAYEVTFFQNAGAAADLSPAILDRTLFHATNSYAIPHVRAVAVSCRTNLPPFTAFRGFGAPQAMFVIESAIHAMAEELGIPAWEIQRRNLLKEGSKFPYGQIARGCLASPCFEAADDSFGFTNAQQRVEEFNRTHVLLKRGLAVMPICFGISFTTTFMNQASALVHVYLDGTVGISTAAVEMGQGVNEKLRRIAATTLGIHDSNIRVGPTTTSRCANTSPTAASKDADLNGFAVLKACREIRMRLLRVGRDLLNLDETDALTLRDDFLYHHNERTDFAFSDLVLLAHKQRCGLSCLMHHATEDIHFDPSSNTGSPFVYHVYGTALIEAEVDCLRGIVRIPSVRVVHDAGMPLDPSVDLGQCEGGIVQGLGWVTMEETVWNTQGKLTSDALSTYKVPDILSIPELLEIRFLENAPNDRGPLQSKAIGEPPFMYGIGAYFALLRAMQAFQPNLASFYNLPMTSERIMMALHQAPVPTVESL